MNAFTAGFIKELENQGLNNKQIRYLHKRAADYSGSSSLFNTPIGNAAQTDPNQLQLMSQLQQQMQQQQMLQAQQQQMPPQQSNG